MNILKSVYCLIIIVFLSILHSATVSSFSMRYGKFAVVYTDSIPIVHTDSVPIVHTDSIPFVFTDSIPFVHTDSLFIGDSIFILHGDTIPSLFLINDSTALDSIPFLPDSLRHRFIIRYTDPLDTLPNRLFAFNVLSRKSHTRTQVVIDTTLTLFGINNPVMRNFYAGAFLGNIGLSYYPVSFSYRQRPSDFFFLDHVSSYLHDPEETIYYNTQTPYSQLNFSSAGPKILNESVFNLVHTQNVNKNWNVGLYYDVFASVGDYVNQNSSVSAFSLFSAYRGEQYEMYSNFNWNNVRMRENGGLFDIAGYEINEEDASSNSVRSGVGRTIMLNRSLHMMQSYSPTKLTFGKNTAEIDSIEVSRFAFAHTLRYEWTSREYIDTATYALRGREPYFWGNRRTGINTHDSLHFRRISNKLEIIFREQSRRKFTAGFSAGAMMEMDRYNKNMIADTVPNYLSYINNNAGWGGDMPPISGIERMINYRETKTDVNSALTGSFFNHTGRFINWDINGRLYFTGHKAGDVNIDGNLYIHYFTAKGRNTLMLGGNIDNFNPGYFMNNYASNVIAWNNDFDMSQEIRLRGEFSMPARGIKVGAHISQLNNHLYFNRLALPQQASELLMTGTAYVETDLRLGHFGFRFRLFGQYSSNEAIIPLPAFAGFQSTYFEAWIVKNVMNMQLGYNLVFNTPYYAYAYMPATGRFYLQNEQKIGNYPFFDFFANFQINRARIFVKTEGLNTVLSSFIGKHNYMVYRYPGGEFKTKFGVSWTFYD